MEKTSTGFCWGSRTVNPLEVTMTVSTGGPIFVLLKSLSRLTIENLCLLRLLGEICAERWYDKVSHLQHAVAADFDSVHSLA